MEGVTDHSIDPQTWATMQAFREGTTDGDVELVGTVYDRRMGAWRIRVTREPSGKNQTTHDLRVTAARGEHVEHFKVEPNVSAGQVDQRVKALANQMIEFLRTL